MKRLTRLTIAALLLMIVSALGVTSFPTRAAAQGDSAKYEQMLKSAVEDYDSLMIDEARQTLENGVTQIEREGASGPAVAKLYVMLGIVRFAESRDSAAAKATFIRALEHDYQVELPAVYSNPNLSEAFEQARAEVEPPAAAPSDAVASGANTAQATGFGHDTIRTARAGEPMEVIISVPADMPVFHVYLHYRRFGEDDYTQVEMKARGATEFTAEIPGDEVRTSQIEYYIEAFDRAEEIIGSAGSQITPLTTTVLGSSGTAAQAKTPGKKGADTEIEVPGTPQDQKFYVMIGGGSGIGLIFDGEPTAHPERDVSAGFAPAFGHALLDFGYMITPKAYVGLYFRWQFTPPQDFAQIPAESKTPGSFFDTREECLGLGLPGDCLLGAKYRYFFSEFSSLRLYSSIGAGVGRIRQWLRLKEPYYQDDGQTVTGECEGKDRINGAIDYCYVRDTVRPGWAHVGFGAGLMMPVHEHIDLVADTYLIVLLPETGLNLDVNVGVNFRF